MARSYLMIGGPRHGERIAIQTRYALFPTYCGAGFGGCKETMCSGIREERYEVRSVGIGSQGEATEGANETDVSVSIRTDARLTVLVHSSVITNEEVLAQYKKLCPNAIERATQRALAMAARR